MTSTVTDLPAAVQVSVGKLVKFLETSGGTVPPGLFAPAVFADLTFPHWRVQLTGDGALAAGRRERHPHPGRVRLERITPTDTGYLVKLEERWEDEVGERWYCREGFVCDLDEAGEIVDFTLYCTGDWDEALQREHARSVTLTRP